LTRICATASKGFKWPGEFVAAINIFMLAKHKNRKLIPAVGRFLMQVMNNPALVAGL